MDNIQWFFFEILRGGLWGYTDTTESIGNVSWEYVDWEEVYRLAEEQSVIGLVAAGIETVQGEWLKVHGSSLVPQEWALQFIGQTLQIEQRNKAMNEFVARLIELLRKNDIYAVLVKGQGIAQCYERPLWRASGDVDLLLSDTNYQKASIVLKEVTSAIEEENKYNKHLAMTIEGWPVELHGTLRSGLWKKLDGVIDEIQKDVFYGGKVGSWQNGATCVFLPAAGEDVVIVFTHILQHFFLEGIGLRQICDWCRLLYTYRESLDHGLLESRIRKAGIMTEWKAFAALAVEYLGMPIKSMPLYSDASRWKRKASRIMDFVLETGNFGHNRDYTYKKKYPYVVMKAISMWKHIKDFGRYVVIFPEDAIKVTWRRMGVGFAVAIRGKWHE